MALPEPPNQLPDRNTQTNTEFSSRIQDLLLWLVAWASAFISASSAYMLSLKGTSTDTLTIAVGAQSFTVESGLGFQVGNSVTVANSATSLMNGNVSSYDENTGAISINIVDVIGSGPFSDWTVSLSAVGASFAADISTEAFQSLAGTNIEAQVRQLETDKASKSELTVVEDAVASSAASATAAEEAVNNLVLSQIDKVVATGRNGTILLSFGKLYIISGDQSSYKTNISGVAPTDSHWSSGVDGAVQIPISGKVVVDVGVIDNTNVWALASDGNLYAWGENDHGQCGQAAGYVQAPYLVDTGVLEVYSSHSQNGYFGDGRLVYKRSDNYLYGCGYNNFGALGLGSTSTAVTTPTQLTAFGQNPISVWNLGTTYGCIFVEQSDGTLLFSGYNGYGQGGTGDTTNVSTPVDVTSTWKNGNTAYRILHADGGFGYRTGSNVAYTSIHMLVEDGSLRFIKNSGHGTGGSIGNGSTGNISTPHQITFSSQIREFAVLGGISTCYALLSNNELHTWGRNGEGQAGHGSTASISSATLAVSDVETILTKGFNAYTYGYRSTAFIRMTSGEIQSAGYNANGECCNGSIATTNVFTRSLLSDFTDDSDDPVLYLGYQQTTTGSMSYVVATQSNRMCAWGHNAQHSINRVGSSVLGPYSFRLRV